MTKIRHQVNKFTAFVPSLQQYLQNKCNSFKAGGLKHHVNAWREITTDPSILETVSGATIEFTDLPPIQGCNRLDSHFSPGESDVVRVEIDKLLAKGIIKPSQHEAGEVISGIFLRPKKDGSYRLILNLKNLNECLEYQYFKTDTLQTIFKLMTKDCFMASIDIKDAYHAIPVDRNFEKFLKFEFEGCLYCFICFSNGLGPCPRKKWLIRNCKLKSLEPTAEL